MIWKKLLCCVVMCIVLSGCQSQTSPTQGALDLRTALLEAGGCSFRAVIGADYGDRVYSFTVSCEYDTDGITELTVLQPEEIAGISAQISDSSTIVEFEDIALDFGKMANGAVSPVKACSVLGRCWSTSYISCGGSDGDLERITYLDGYEEQELTVDTWLDNSAVPVYAEISYDGTRCLTLQLSDFEFEEDL